jgi:hypothetical protein
MISLHPFASANITVNSADCNQEITHREQQLMKVVIEFRISKSRMIFFENIAQQSQTLTLSQMRELSSISEFIESCRIVSLFQVLANVECRMFGIISISIQRMIIIIPVVDRLIAL